MSDNLAMLEPRDLNRLLAIERAAKRAVRRFFTPGASALVVMGDLRRALQGPRSDSAKEGHEGHAQTSRAKGASKEQG